MGFQGKHFTPNRIEHKCYKCSSTDLEKIPAVAWTSQWRCNQCKYYNFIIYADFMSGAFHEDVYISKEKYN